MVKACSIVPNEQPGHRASSKVAHSKVASSKVASSKVAHSTLKEKIFSENVPFLQMSPCMVPGPSSHITSFTS